MTRLKKMKVLYPTILIYEKGNFTWFSLVYPESNHFSLPTFSTWSSHFYPCRLPG